MCPDFIEVLNNTARTMNLEDRVEGVVGAIENLPFNKEEFDLIWSEGAIDSIGFETGLLHWKDFLKKAGYIAVTCPSWFTDEHPTEVEKFWSEAGSNLDTVSNNISIMQRAGYSYIASFALPENCWIDNYFDPRTAVETTLQEQNPDNETLKEYIESSEYEIELYSKYKQHYGYVFYIGRKL
jgi:ubiquinone/menaquinone biosynthesis C-methylase UbiE